MSKILFSPGSKNLVGITTTVQWHTECQLQSFFFHFLLFSGYKLSCQLSRPDDSSPPPFLGVWRGWIYSLQLRRLHRLCPECHGSFKESYLVSMFSKESYLVSVFSFLHSLWGSLFSQTSVINYSKFLWGEELLGKISPLNCHFSYEI